MAKLQFQTMVTSVDTEDGGMAKIATLTPPRDTELFVRLQSWDKSKNHMEFHEFYGRRVKVTIETID